MCQGRDLPHTPRPGTSLPKARPRGPGETGRDPGPRIRESRASLSLLKPHPFLPQECPRPRVQKPLARARRGESRRVPRAGGSAAGGRRLLHTRSRALPLTPAGPAIGCIAQCWSSSRALALNPVPSDTLPDVKSFSLLSTGLYIYALKFGG